MDLTSSEYVEIKVTLMHDGFRVWVNTPEGCGFRAYRVGRVEFDIDDDTKAALKQQDE